MTVLIVAVLTPVVSETQLQFPDATFYTRPLQLFFNWLIFHFSTLVTTKVVTII